MSDFPITNGVVTFSSPPEGYVVDFDNPQRSLHVQHYWLFAVGGLLAFLSLGQRLYTKISLANGLQIDDVFFVLAWIFSMATQGVNTWSLGVDGLGVHAWEMPIERYNLFTLSMYISAPTYAICNGFAKLSLLTFYLQISPQTWFRYLVWATIGIVVCYSTVISLLLIFGCQPIQQAWDIGMTDGTCIDRAPLYIATAVTNIITDFIMCGLPIKMVMGTRMKSSQKAIAVFVFAVGSMTFATSIIRLVLLLPLLHSADQPWDTAPASMWVFVEANLLIICCSIPTMRKFFRHAAPKLCGSEASNEQSSNANPNSNRATGNLYPPRKHRNQYEKFSDGNELYAMSGRVRSGNDQAMTVEIATGRGSADDDRSDKAIMENSQIVQTKTVTVQYE